jgi:hypothetical protein
MKILISKSALPPSLYRKFVKGWDKGRYADLFQKYSGDRNSYRIYLPIVKSNKLVDVPVPSTIDEAVTSKGYQIDDYINGIAVDSSGKRRIKIGKLLPVELQQVFANDKSRQGARNAAQGGMCVISRHPYDVAGMSTGRGWRSCMNLIRGSNKRYVDEDIKAGSVVAYLVPNSDKDSLNLKSPNARMLLRVYEASNGKRGLYPSGIYGTGTADFMRTVFKWCTEVNVNYFGIPYGTSMHLLSGLYDDGAPDVVNDEQDQDISAQRIAALIDADQVFYKQIDHWMIMYGPDITPILSKLKNRDQLGEVVSYLLDTITNNANTGKLNIAESLHVCGEFSTNHHIPVKFYDANCTSQTQLFNISAINLTESKLSFDDAVHMAQSPLPDIYNRILSNCPDTNLINSYALFGLDVDQAVTLLMKSVTWQSYPISDLLTAAYKKRLAITKEDIDSDPLSGQFIPTYNKVEFIRAMKLGMSKFLDIALKRRIPLVDCHYYIPAEATDKLVREVPNDEWKKIWRGTSVIPCLGFQFKQQRLSKSAREFAAQVAVEANKYAKVDADRSYVWTKAFGDCHGSLANANTMFCPEFLSAIDPKLLSTTFYQSLLLNMSKGLTYSVDMEGIDALVASNNKLAIVCRDGNLNDDEDHIRTLNAIRSEPAFTVQCLRNIKAARLPAIYEVSALHFYIEGMAEREQSYFVELGFPDIKPILERLALICEQ